MARARTAMLGALVVVGSFAAGAVGVEAAFRAAHGEPLTSFPQYVYQRLDLIRRASGPVTFDTTLGWRLRDNYEAPDVFRFSTGPLGIRSNGPPLKSLEPGATLAVGDSFTAGSGVQDHETWPAILATLWGAPVYNAASGGWGVDQMILRAEQLAPELKPRTVLVGILSQDSLRNNFDLYGGAYKPYFRPLPNGGLELAGVPVVRLEQRPPTLGFWRGVLGYSFVVDWAVMRLGFGTRWITPGLHYNQIYPNETGVTISCGLMDRLAELRQRFGARPVVIMQYGAAEAEGAPPPWYGPPVLACARARGFAVVDTYGPLHELAKTDRERFVALWLNEGGQLGHMSPAGNAFIARLIADTIPRD
jgi:hypothetical protein